MSTTLLAPPLTAPPDLQGKLKEQGFAVLSPQAASELNGIALSELLSLNSFWNDLPPDQYLKDGGRYRRRRHGSFLVDGDTVTQHADRAHWQPLSYNALHGGMRRWFAPLEAAMTATAAWSALLSFLGHVASGLRGDQTWFVEAHPFRIDTTDGIGRPTPEGAHRDGVDLVAVFLIGRHSIKGGETRVFDVSSPFGQRFTLTEPWSVLLLDDARVIHETTPIQPQGELGWRDTLVITLRSGGFLDEPSKTAA
jgi:hypothetical protein